MRRAFLLAALLTLTVLAGCAQKEATPPAAVVDQPPSNVGGSDKAVTSVFPGEYDFSGPFSNVLSKGALGLKAPERVMIPSPIDGSNIELGLHLPDTDQPVPVLVFASPYFFADGSPGGTRTVLDQTPKSSFFSLVENFVPHGYAVVAVAVRGTAGSNGCNDLMGPDEIDDLDAAITWIAQQKWSTGKVAMTGVSYDGSTPWSVASRGNPALKTILPISGVPDIYGLMYRNGSSESRGPFLLNALYIEGSYASAGGPSDVPTRFCAEAYQGLGLSGVAGVTGSDPTGYWAERNRKPNVEANYKGSVFSIQGLQDWNVDPSQVVPWVDQLEAKGLVTRQLLGQWEHSWPDNIGEKGEGMDCPNGNPDVAACNRADWKEIMLRWLDHELKGDMSVDIGAPVQVADDLGRWRNEEHFPPHDAVWTTYQLDHGLLTNSTGARESAVLYPSVSEDFPPNPPPAVDFGVKKAADFTLGPLENDLLISGLPKVHVSVTPDGPGGYMGAYLFDVDPKAHTERRIGWTSMNLAYADGTLERKEVIPGQMIEAMMEIQPMDSVVVAGHQLVLRLWVFTAPDRVPTLPPSPVALETGGDVESVLILPTITRDPSVYFEPPAPSK
ncbi:MAG: X-Pro dipeptidyl-peptidase [Thermoplasmata archaeon]|nr:X-Pro dipeptidyl-peptidase [Thermoplasmata archaeon]